MISEHVYTNSLLNLFFKNSRDFLHTSIVTGADGSLSAPVMMQTESKLDPDTKFNCCSICQKSFSVHKRYECTKCFHHFCAGCVRDKFVSPLETIPGPVCYLCQSTFSSGFDSLEFLNTMLQYDLLLHPSPYVITTALLILQDRLMHPQYRMALSTTTYVDVYSQLAFLTERSTIQVIKTLENKENPRRSVPQGRESSRLFCGHGTTPNMVLGGERLRAQVQDPFLHSKKTEKVMSSPRIKAALRHKNNPGDDPMHTELKHVCFDNPIPILEGCLGCLINITTPTASSSNNELQEFNSILADACGKQAFERNLMKCEPLDTLVGNAFSLNSEDINLSNLPGTYKFRLRNVAASGIPKICRLFLGRIRVFDIPPLIDTVTSFAWIVKNLSFVEFAQFEDNYFSKKMSESLLELGAMQISIKNDQQPEKATTSSVVGCAPVDDNPPMPGLVGYNRRGEFELYRGITYSMDAKVYNNLLEFCVCAFVNIRSMSSENLSEVALSGIDVIIQKLFKWAQSAARSGANESFNSAITTIICALRCWHDKTGDRQYRQIIDLNNNYVWNSMLELLDEGLERGVNHQGMDLILVCSALRMTIKEYIKQISSVNRSSSIESRTQVRTSTQPLFKERVWDTEDRGRGDGAGGDGGMGRSAKVQQDKVEGVAGVFYTKKMESIVRRMLVLAESSYEWAVEVCRLMSSLVAVDPKTFSIMYRRVESVAIHFDRCFDKSIHPMELVHDRLRRCLEALQRPEETEENGVEGTINKND